MNAQQLIDFILDAVARHDHRGIAAYVADKVELNTPRFLKPINDRNHVLIVLATVPKIVENFCYDRTWASGREAIMEFKGNIGDVVVHGLDIFHLDDDGKIDELTVFVRPTKAHAALGAAEDALILEQLEKMKAGSPA